MGLERFVEAQAEVYPIVLAELRAAAKQTHWMWFIFPQLRGLGTSAMARRYGIADLIEARDYLRHRPLGTRLLECTGLLLAAPAALSAMDMVAEVDGNTGPTTGISQTVATGVGSYKLSFFVGNASPTGSNGGNYTQPSTVNLSINGGPIQSFTNSLNTPFGINWAPFSVTFFAETPTTIAFTNGTTGDNMLGLDNVSVTAVPEPASWAMLIAGFGLTGAAMRRRRSAVLA